MIDYEENVQGPRTDRTYPSQEPIMRAGPDVEAPVRCSLLVLNYDERDLLLDCVGSMVDAVGPSDEIIVVDNGSSDGSADALHNAFPWVQVLRLPENRYIFSLNAGLEVARGEFVAFCNNDMRVEKNFVDQAVACFVSDDVFAVCPRVLDGNGIEQGTRTAGFWKHGLLFYESLAHTAHVTDCFFAVGGQSFFRRALLHEIGSIDELFWPMYHEDIELSYRAWKNGYRIVYAPESVCHHLGSQTSRRVFTPIQRRSFVRQNELLTVWKDVNDRSMLVQHVLWAFPRLMTALFRWDTGTLIGFCSALRRLPWAIRRRRAVQEKFLRSDREVLEMVSASAIESRSSNATLGS
jgi:GT2 family glycosyltransferase